MDQRVNDKYSRFLDKIEKIDVDLMQLIANSSETAIFNAKPITDLIQYQWAMVGFNFHLIGFSNFFIYLIMLIIYIVQVYINDRLYVYEGGERKKVNDGPNNIALVLLFGLIYPIIYLSMQIKITGIKVITNPRRVDPFIYIDTLFIITCLLTVMFQLANDPQEFICKVLLIVQIGIICFKTFKYLRVISQYSPLVTMLQKVSWGLRFFFTLFFTNVIFFTQLIKILQLDLPGSYEYLGTFLGYILEGFKLSLRKKTVIKSFRHDVEDATQAKTITFWLCWLLVIFIQAIMFLKFIKAEAKAIYIKVKKQLKETVMKDKCQMISEAEQMVPSTYR